MTEEYIPKSKRRKSTAEQCRSVEEAEGVIQSLSATIKGLETVRRRLLKTTQTFKLPDKQEKLIADVHLDVDTALNNLETLKKDWENLKLELLGYP